MKGPTTAFTHNRNITHCTFAQAPEILEIFNDAILNSTVVYDYEQRTMAHMEAWFEAKNKGGYPVLGAFEEDGSLAGFASFGPFRVWPAYKYSIEHSIYIADAADTHGRMSRIA